MSPENVPAEEAKEKAVSRLPALVWIDMEMTGLDPETCHVLEIATIVTNGELEVIATGPQLVVHQPDGVLENMGVWCVHHHRESGLTTRVRQSTTTLEEAEAQTLRFLERHTTSGSSPLCGNSVGQDRRFIEHHMPKLAKYLHYRTVDVSTVKELAKRWYPDLEPVDKKGSHRALDDIRESIAEMRFYREKLFK